MRAAWAPVVSLLGVLAPAAVLAQGSALAQEAAPPSATPAEAPAPVAAPVTTGVAPPAPAAVAPRRFPRLERPSLTHTMQFGVALLPGSGYRGIIPYGENIECGQLTKRVCSGRMPFFIDAQLSFGIGQSWDALVDLRFGLERDFTQTRQFAVAPGFRYWIDPELIAKFFASVQLVIDTTNQANPLVQNTDFGIRNADGFMVDVMRNLGIYMQFGVTVGMRRWLRFEIDGGVGVQARFP